MKKSSLLINENPLQVLPSLAIILGLEEAIAIQQLHYWLNNTKNEGRIDEDGNKWVYNTYSQWQEDNFPFWSEDKIQRIFLSLEKQGVVIARQLDAKKRDMKKFYRIDYDALCAMDSLKIAPSDSLKSAPSNTAKLHDVKMNQRLPETTTSKSDPFGFMKFSEELKNKQNMDEVEQIVVKLEVGLRFNFPRGTRDQVVYKRILRSGKSIDKFIEWVKSDEKRLSYAFLYAKDTETIWRDLPQIETNISMNPQGLIINE